MLDWNRTTAICDAAGSVHVAVNNLRDLFKAYNDKEHSYDQMFTEEIALVKVLAYYDTVEPSEVPLLRQAVEACKNSVSHIMDAFEFPTTGVELRTLASAAVDEWTATEAALEKFAKSHKALSCMVKDESPDLVFISEDLEKLVAALQSCEQLLPTGKTMKMQTEVCVTVDTILISLVNTMLEFPYDEGPDDVYDSLHKSMRLFNRSSTYHLALGTVIEAKLSVPLKGEAFLDHTFATIRMMRNVVQFLNPDFVADFDARCKGLKDFACLSAPADDFEKVLAAEVFEASIVKTFKDRLAALQTPGLGKSLHDAVLQVLKPLLVTLMTDVLAVLGDAPLTVRLSDGTAQCQYSSHEIQGFAQVLALAQQAGFDGLVRELLLLRDTHILLREASSLALDFKALTTPDARKITATFVDRVLKLTARKVHLAAMGTNEV